MLLDGIWLWEWIWGSFQTEASCSTGAATLQKPCNTGSPGCLVGLGGDSKSPGVGAEVGSSSRNDPQVPDMSQPEGGKGDFSEFTHGGTGFPHTNARVF